MQDIKCQNKPVIRNTSIELLRIVCMIFIVLHHFISQVVAPNFSSRWWTGIDVIFHTSVIVFVLISGYFGIKLKTKRFINLLLQVITYSVALTTLSIIVFKQGTLFDIIKSFLPIGGQQYWFVGVYLQLMLVAPMINFAVSYMRKRQFQFLILVFAFFVFYLGLVCHNPICIDGKNIVNFIFIYLIGRYINVYEFNIGGKKSAIVSTIILLIIGMVSMLPNQHNLYLHGMAFIYQYHSPLLVALSVLIFITAKNYKFYNNTINAIAASAFSIYLIHEHPLMREYIYVRPVQYLMGYFDDVLLFFVLLVCALVLSILCVGVDKIRMGFFNLFDNKIDTIGNKIDKYFCL